MEDDVGVAAVIKAASAEYQRGGWEVGGIAYGLVDAAFIARRGFETARVRAELKSDGRVSLQVNA